MVLGDGLFDAVSALSIDTLKPPADRGAGAMARNRRRIFGALNKMKEAANRFSGDILHIRHICFAGGLAILNLRRPWQKLLIQETGAAFDWRVDWPTLHAWYDEAIERPSLKLCPAGLGIIGIEKPKSPLA
jgi:hypothetical protein